MPFGMRSRRLERPRCCRALAVEHLRAWAFRHDIEAEQKMNARTVKLAQAVRISTRTFGCVPNSRAGRLSGSSTTPPYRPFAQRGRSSRHRRPRHLLCDLAEEAKPITFVECRTASLRQVERSDLAPR